MHVNVHAWQCFQHPKIMSLPLGIPKASARALLRLLHMDREQVCNSTRIEWLMINFSWYRHRKAIVKQLLSQFPHLSNMYGKNRHGKLDSSNRPRFDYYTQLRCSRFVACPSGLGWDTYRLWEALSLGAIPIVEDSPGWIRVLDKLPVLIVKNFDEVTPQLLEREYARIIARPKNYDFKRLTTQWWIDRIHSLLPDPASTVPPGGVPVNTSMCRSGDSAGCMHLTRTSNEPQPDCCVMEGDGGNCAQGFVGYQTDELCWHDGSGVLEHATLFAYKWCCTRVKYINN